MARKWKLTHNQSTFHNLHVILERVLEYVCLLCSTVTIMFVSAYNFRRQFVSMQSKTLSSSSGDFLFSHNIKLGMAIVAPQFVAWLHENEFPLSSTSTSLAPSFSGMAQSQTVSFFSAKLLYTSLPAWWVWLNIKLVLFYFLQLTSMVLRSSI